MQRKGKTGHTRGGGEEVINRNCLSESSDGQTSPDKEFKSSIINTLKELKEIMSKELKESMRMSHQIETNSKETEL